MKKRWFIEPPIPPEIDQQLSPFPFLFRQILFNRGISTEAAAQEFLYVSGPVYSPFSILGMQEAVSRIIKAIKIEENIVVFGDYDADGITATALLIETLDCLGIRATYYTPNRFDEGYGLSRDAIFSFAQQDVTLIITVDCGIRSAEEVEFASELGIDVIITDHHYPLGKVPSACAVLCPKQEGDQSINKDLAGVGLAYKLCQALLSQRNFGESKLNDMLDLVALGTIADMVPLTGENRFLVRKGLEEIRKGQRTGLKKLADKSGIDIRNVTSSNVGYTLAPRLNAAGRLQDDTESTLELFRFCRAASDDVAVLGLGTLSVQLLIEDDVVITEKIAERLCALNMKRQEATRLAVMKGRELIPKPLPALISICDASFSEGIIGLVASRLCEEFFRPCIVFTDLGDVLKASCRSIPQFHITQALDMYAELMVRHGGHAAAAGLTVLKNNKDELITRVAELASRELSNFESLCPQLRVDALIRHDQLAFLNPKLSALTELLEPTGIGNPYPIFAIESIAIKNTTFFGKKSTSHDGSKEQQPNEDIHARFSLDSVNKNSTPPCVWFKVNDQTKEVVNGRLVNVAFTFEKNHYRQAEYFQLVVRDIEFM